MNRRDAPGEGESPRIDLSYPLAELDRAMAAGGQDSTRASAWRAVIHGMLEGVLDVGSRTPIAGTPAWVTPEVVHGGFATGRWVAGGALAAHERTLLAAIGHGEVIDTPEARRLLNAYHLSEPGREALRDMLASGRYRIDAPEEGALMVVEWLRTHGAERGARALLSTIAPWVDRLRFFPRPAARPVPADEAVFAATAEEVVAGLRTRTVPAHVQALREALLVWTPMYDRCVRLVLVTVEDERPFARRPVDWDAQVRDLLDDYARARAVHRLCRKPDAPKENFARLREHLAVVIATAGEPPPGAVAGARRIIERYLARHGHPDGPRRAAVRERQARDAGLPLHADLARVLADRIAARDNGGGIAGLDALLGPLDAGEAVRAGISEGARIPRPLTRRAMRALEAPVEELVDRGIVTSAEGVAMLVPALTAATRAGAIPDAELRGVYVAEYRAFRHRRSLLLLRLQSQVQFEELPWIAALRGRIDVRGAPRGAPRNAMARATSLVLTRFPDTLLPNGLIRELHALAGPAGLRIPLTYELAADIFTGRFSRTVGEAAATAAALMGGTLYARYYDLTDRPPANLAALCVRRAQAVDARPGSDVAWNGMVIEQAQILTTHNLAQLVDALDLRGDLAPQALDLA